MRRCAIIACDHGLGHIRRCCLIAREMEKQGWEPILFAPKQKFEQMAAIFRLGDRVRNYDFSTHTDPDALRRGESLCLDWHRRLPDMQGYDLVVSDNLPEVLNVRPDAIMCGQFLWHDVLDKVHGEYASRAQSLLYRYRPPFVSSDLFAMPAIKIQPNYRPVGLYADRCDPEDGVPKMGLLISGGSTTIINNVLQPVVNRFVEAGPSPFETIFVDKNLLPENAPEWITMATYDQDMYSTVAAAICRPGIGTLTDLLCHGGRPFCLYESGNMEMQYNAQVLEQRDLGNILSDKAFSEAILRRYILDARRMSMHGLNCAKLSFQGARMVITLMSGLDSLGQ